IDARGCQALAAKDVAAADDDADLHVGGDDVGHFARDPRGDLGVDTVIELAEQGFAAELEQNPAIGGGLVHVQQRLLVRSCAWSGLALGWKRRSIRPVAGLALTLSPSRWTSRGGSSADTTGFSRPWPAP